ncbi:MAG TPA: hypothetical protein VMG12_37620, partial [Polyangiaceae bacterium]|nr:hypothetical protein [Polyangiaceae bacterium]
MVRPSLISTIAFLVIVVAVALAFPAAVWLGTLRTSGPEPARRSALRACAATLAVLAASALLAESGALASVPHGLGVVAYFVICNAGAALLAFSGVGQRMAQTLPLYALVGFHLFRLPLELVLHQWYMEGVLPVQMTYAGQNFDIATGLLALFIAPLMYYGKLSRRAAWLFNLIGSALLANVASIAVRSSPVPLRTYLNEPPVLLALNAPFTWILPVCVS